MHKIEAKGCNAIHHNFGNGIMGLSAIRQMLKDTREELDKLDKYLEAQIERMGESLVECRKKC